MHPESKERFIQTEVKDGGRITDVLRRKLKDPRREAELRSGGRSATTR